MYVIKQGIAHTCTEPPFIKRTSTNAVHLSVCRYAVLVGRSPAAESLIPERQICMYTNLVVVHYTKC